MSPALSQRTGHTIEEPTMIHELNSVALTRDLPEHGLTVGDVGTIVSCSKTQPRVKYCA